MTEEQEREVRGAVNALIDARVAVREAEIAHSQALDAHGKARDRYNAALHAIRAPEAE